MQKDRRTTTLTLTVQEPLICHLSTDYTLNSHKLS